jgi:hypothetical protein
MVKKITVKRVQTLGLSQVCQSDDSFTIFDGDVNVYKEDGELLAVFRKGVALKNKKIITAGRGLLQYKHSSTSRKMAAGTDEKAVGRYKGGMGAANKVFSSMVGYVEPIAFYKCRETTMYAKHKDKFRADTLPLVQFISRKFRQYAPKQYNKQKKFVDQLNQNMVLPDTVFTTFSVNVDFRTRTHRDQGDYSSGLGNLMVFNVGDFTGGETLLPEYKIGFHIEEGDMLFFDVHEVHCNNPIKGKGRISIVAFAREKILQKCQGITQQQLTDNSYCDQGKKKKK